MTQQPPAPPAAPAKRTAVFAGSFDPFTIGHADIVKRGLELFDSVAICIGVNPDKPQAAMRAQERAEQIRQCYSAEPRVTVDCWTGLTADYARRIGATHLLRGIRTVKDMEYERDMADANRCLLGIDTVAVFASPELGYVSSSLVRELSAHGCDVTHLLPRGIKPPNASQK